jgi:hypothetical protein
MKGLEILYVLITLFTIRIVLPAAIIAGLGTLLKKVQTAS